MINENKPMCIVCGRRTDYNVSTQIQSIEIRGAKVNYVESTAFCALCGTEIYVPEINDKNADARKTAYAKTIAPL